MPELAFALDGVEIERYAVTPTLRFRLRITADQPVENIALQCQLRIEPMRRAYGGDEHERLADLFGEKARWGDTLKSFLWTIVPVNVPRFDDVTIVDAMVPCSFDFDVAATKYFHGLEGGEVPVSLLFSGSVFYRDPQDRLQISQLSWSQGLSHRLPAALWQTLMDQYYPNAAWLRLDRETFERLYALKRRMGVGSFDAALSQLLSAPQVLQ
ncbi:MAG TPA: DUF6084 family protein [Micropepsaceae bacterium]|jgi:hypothetical protein